MSLAFSAVADRLRTVLRDDGVADVRLTRPDKMNALDAAMFEGLIETAARLAGEPGLRAVVLSGEGRAFCAGLDMENFGRMAEVQGDVAAPAGRGALFAGRLTERTHGLANAPQQVALAWRDLPVPVIAAVHGVAFGGGLQVALGADLRFLAPETRLSVMEIKWGLVPDMSGMLLMRTLLRDDVMRDLVYSGRVVGAVEAVALGLATRVADDPLAEALTYAAAIAARSPDAIRAAKRLLRVAAEGDAAAVLMAESVEQEALMGRANQREAVLANLEKRAPVFGDAPPPP